MSIAPKPEWDTPPHGDFAAYVERLSGAVPGAQSAGRLLQASSPATRRRPDRARCGSLWPEAGVRCAVCCRGR